MALKLVTVVGLLLLNVSEKIFPLVNERLSATVGRVNILNNRNGNDETISSFLKHRREGSRGGPGGGGVRRKLQKDIRGSWVYVQGR